MRACFLLCAVASVFAQSPPATRIDNVTEVIHGVRIADPYRWLEDQTSPETRAWIEKQNGYARSLLDRIPEREAIRKRLGELMRFDDTETPVPAGGACTRPHAASVAACPEGRPLQSPDALSRAAAILAGRLGARGPRGSSRGGPRAKRQPDDGRAVSHARGRRVRHAAARIRVAEDAQVRQRGRQVVEWCCPCSRRGSPR